MCFRKNVCSNKKAYTRNFNMGLYNAAEWLCGYENKNVFFCFTYLIMRASDNAWTVRRRGELTSSTEL